MLTVHTDPAVEADAQMGWQLVYWLGDAFDYEIPFRAALEEIFGILARPEPSVLSIPSYQQREDFIEGSISFGFNIVRVYYEYPLGYLALGNSDKQVMDGVASLLAPSIKLR